MSNQEQLPTTEQLPVIHSEMTTKDLAEALVASAEGHLVLTEEQNQTLQQLIRSKVDGCFEFRAAVEDEIARYKKWSDEFKAQAQRLQKNLDRFEEYITFTMRSTDLQKLPGERFQIALVESQETVQPEKDPTEDDFKHMPQFVRQKIKYEWDKTEIKKALKEGSYPLSNASLKTNYNPRFSIKKGK